MARCGTDSGYHAGCRCASCRAAHAEKNRQWRQRNPIRTAKTKAAEFQRNGRRRERLLQADHDRAAEARRRRAAVKRRCYKRGGFLMRERGRLRRQYYVARRRGAHTEEDVAYEITLRSDPCAYCGRRGGAIDHIEATGTGGANGWENLTGACGSCNSQKGTRSLLAHLLRT